MSRFWESRKRGDEIEYGRGGLDTHSLPWRVPGHEIGKLAVSAASDCGANTSEAGGSALTA